MPYGWKDFDETIVAEIRVGKQSAVDKSPSGGLVCPLMGHCDQILAPGPPVQRRRNWLRWVEGRYACGTEYHAEPAVRFRVEPTYIYKDAIHNFIAGEDLIREALTGAWNKAEVHRLGHENSEDAVSWNVFRALQEAGCLNLIVQLFAARTVRHNVDLYCWGRKIEPGRSLSWTKFESIRKRIEPGLGIQTEPDVCLHVPGSLLIFVEAKLTSRAKRFKPGETERMRDWIKRYRPFSAELFNCQHLSSAKPEDLPEQLLRNIVFANAVRDSRNEQAVVIGLIREGDNPTLESWVSSFLSSECPVTFKVVSWEDLYFTLPSSDPKLSTVRTYLESKSASLQKAFKIPREAHGTS